MILEARTHLTFATVRRDGSPRISGTECRFHGDDLWIGSMSSARKAQDLGRDPRYALHSGSDDPPAWTGDAKVAGIVEEVRDRVLIAEVNGSADPGPDGTSHLFRLDVREASEVRLAPSGKMIVIEWWTPERGVQRLERA